MRKIFAKTAFVALLATFLGGSTIAFADSEPGDVDRFIKVCDTNNDGMVSKAEVMKRAEDVLAKIQPDKNGMISLKRTMELLANLKQSESPSGYMLSKTDFMKMLDKAFVKSDASKKGMLDHKQFEAFWAELSKSGG